MHRNERTLLLTVVGILAIFNISLLLQQPGTSAVAQDASTDPVLGPAASVELVDTGEENVEMKLQNKDGHLAWGSASQQQTYSVAYVHTGAILGQLMDSQEFEEERTAFSEEVQEKDEEFRQQLEEIGKEWEEMQPDDPGREEISQRGQQLYEEFQAFQQQVELMRQSMTSEQLERAYRELISAVNVVSDRMKIDVVYRFIPTEDEFQGGSIESAMQEIRLRSVLRYPETADITSDVIEELDLDEE